MCNQLHVVDIYDSNSPKQKFFNVNFAAIFSRKFSNRFGKEQNVSPPALNLGPSDIYSATPTAKPLN